MPRTIAINLKLQSPHNVVLGTVMIPRTNEDAAMIAKTNSGIPYYGPSFRNDRQKELCNEFYDKHPEMDYNDDLRRLIKEAIEKEKEKTKKLNFRSPSVPKE